MGKAGLAGCLFDRYTIPRATSKTKLVEDPPYLKQQKRDAKIDYAGLLPLATGIGAAQIVFDKGDREDFWFHSNYSRLRGSGRRVYCDRIDLGVVSRKPCDRYTLVSQPELCQVVHDDVC